MKRFWNIYEKIYDLDNLRTAHRMARKDKALYKEVQMVNSNPDYYLNQIQIMLKEKKYRITAKNYTVSVIRDRTKSRELRKLNYYPHRIIQRAIMLQIEKAFMKVFTEFTCASIRWRWWKQVRKLMDKYMKDKEWTAYCLKIDIQKFYPSVNHKILKKLLRKKFKDKDLLNLLDMIIDSFPWKRWLPIWSYLSQFLANYYLAFFDHHMKEKIRCKYVIRYMDDIIVLWRTAKRLRYVYRRMKAYLDGRLDLKIKDNRQIFPTDKRWIDFVWYRYFHWYKLLRKRTCKRLKKKIIKLNQTKKMIFRQRCSMNSYIWWLKRCDAYRLKQKRIIPLKDRLIDYYKNVLKGHRRYEKNLLKNLYLIKA